VGQGHLIIEASQPHSDSPHLVGLLWVSEQPDTETTTWQHTTSTRQTYAPQWDLSPQSQQVTGYRHTP